MPVDNDRLGKCSCAGLSLSLRLLGQLQQPDSSIRVLILILFWINHILSTTGLLRRLLASHPCTVSCTGYCMQLYDSILRSTGCATLWGAQAC